MELDVIVKHYSKILWHVHRWPNFSAKELSCICCGEYYHDHDSLDMLQAARTESGRIFHINSGHRCKRHNADVRGAENSQHLKIAFDISLRGHDHKLLEKILRKAGFSTFGYYGSFIHVDKRLGRIWYSKKGRKLWLGE